VRGLVFKIPKKRYAFLLGTSFTDPNERFRLAVPE